MIDIKKNQNGAATLLVAIILLIGITLIALFATRLGILDQKISGNEYRHKEAFAKAEAGLDQAASYLRKNVDLHEGLAADGWASCTGSELIFPCNQNDAQQVYGVVNVGVSITSSVNLIAALTNAESYLVKTTDTTMAIGRGLSADGTGEAIAMVEYAKVSLLTPGQIPPLMTPNADLSGSFTIVPDPNGGGPGVPISAWVKDLDGSKNTGSWQTCHHGDFQDGVVCMDAYDDSDSWLSCGCVENLSNKDNVNDDIVVASITGEPFPESPFSYLFGSDEDAENVDGDGVTDSDRLDALIEDKIDYATDFGIVLDDCSSLDTLDLTTLNQPFVWVEGICNIPSNNVYGSRDLPIVLVAQGDLTINSNVEIWGIVFGFADFTMNGSPAVHGSVISENASKLTNGGYSQIYDESVFEKLADDNLLSEIAKIQYSWRDF